MPAPRHQPGDLDAAHHGGRDGPDPTDREQAARDFGMLTTADRAGVRSGVRATAEGSDV
jgi:hypothetical protein